MTTPRMLTPEDIATELAVSLDTGIFNPGGVAANVGESCDVAHARAANGLSFGARARRWLTRLEEA